MAKEDEPKAGADIGKIVNLMAGDTNRVCHCVSTKHVNLNVCVDRKDGHSFVFGLFRYILMPLAEFPF